MLQFALMGWLIQVSEELQPFWLHASVLPVGNVRSQGGDRSIMLNELHENHPGISKMKALARSMCGGLKWNLVSACVACQSVKLAPTLTPLQPWQWPTRPFQHEHIDLAGPFCGKMFFLLLNADSKWPEVVEMSCTIIEVLNGCLLHMGCRSIWFQTMVPNLYQRSSNSLHQPMG